MRHTRTSKQSAGERIVKDIKRKTRKAHSTYLNNLIETISVEKDCNLLGNILLVLQSSDRYLISFSHYSQLSNVVKVYIYSAI